MTKIKPEHYVSNKELLQEIIASKERGELTPRTWELFEMMINGIFKRLRYHNLDDADDCKQSARMDLHAYWKSFNPEKSDNPFSYYTQMIKHGAAKGFAKLHPRDQSFISLNDIYNI